MAGSIQSANAMADLKAVTKTADDPDFDQSMEVGERNTRGGDGSSDDGGHAPQSGQEQQAPPPRPAIRSKNFVAVQAMLLHRPCSISRLALLNPKLMRQKVRLSNLVSMISHLVPISLRQATAQWRKPRQAGPAPKARPLKAHMHSPFSRKIAH
jgi:hypothetical protein